MRFYPKQHPLYCGIDLHARTLDVCRLRQDGEVMLPRPRKARPAALLKAIAPSRNAMVIAVAWLLPWSWLAALGAPEGRPVVLGHALAMPASQGGTTTHDQMDSQTSAVLLRGARLPQTSVSPAAMRATRALLRRRTQVRRQRAALLAHLHTTTRQYHLPEMGKKVASKAHRDGVAERFPAPAVPQSLAGDRALLGPDAQRRRDVARSLRTPAQPPQAQPLARRRPVPGSGARLRCGRRSARQESTRCPRGQEGLASGRLVTGTTAAAGQRDGTSGPTSGTAPRTGAFAAAAGLLLRAHPAGHQALPTLEKNHGAGPAWPRLGQPRGRPVSAMCQRHPAGATGTGLHGAGSAAAAPHAALDHPGRSRRGGLGPASVAAAWNAEEPSGPCARLLWPVIGPPLRLLSRSDRRSAVTWAAPPPSLRLTGARHPCSHPWAEDGTRLQRGGSVVATTQSGLCPPCHTDASTSIRVWGSHGGAPANGNDDSTCGQRRMTLSLTTSGKNEQNPLLGVGCLLTTGVLIRVRCRRWQGVPRPGKCHLCRLATAPGTALYRGSTWSRLIHSSASLAIQMSNSSSTAARIGNFCGITMAPLLGVCTMNAAKCVGIVLRSCVTSTLPACAASANTSGSGTPASPAPCAV